MIGLPLRCVATGLGWIDLILELGPRACRVRSHLFLLAGRPGDALRCALDGLDTSPGSAELHYRAARAALALARYPYARARMAYATALEPENHAYRFGLAYTAQRCGELDVAEREYDFLLSHFPQDFSARLNLSLVHKAQGLYGAALAGFEEVASAKPKEEKALYGAALSAYRLGDAQRALRWAQRCVKVNGRHHKHLLLGNLAVEREDFEKAEAYFEDARSLNPDDGRSLAALGRLKIRSDEPARGRHLLREALLVPEPDTTAHFDLAQYYERRRQLRKPNRWYALYIGIILDRGPIGLNTGVPDSLKSSLRLRRRRHDRPIRRTQVGPALWSLRSQRGCSGR